MTEAPGMAAPEGSVTMPWSIPLAIEDRVTGADCARKAAMTAAARQINIRFFITCIVY